MKKMKKYIRTKSGDIWELNSDGCYQKTNYGSIVNAGDSLIVDSSDNIMDLIHVGDLVTFCAGHSRTVDKEDLINNGHVSSFWKINKIYTKCVSDSSFQLQAVLEKELWIIK